MADSSRARRSRSPARCNDARAARADSSHDFLPKTDAAAPAGLAAVRSGGPDTRLAAVAARARSPLQHATPRPFLPSSSSLVLALLAAPAILRAPVRRHAAAATLLPPPLPAFSSARHLIIVAGHAIYTDASGRDRGRLALESSWFLEPFQHGQLGTMLAHVERGVALAAADNSSILLFSGGETRAAAGPRSEAASYWEAAESRGWFGAAHVRPRAQLEAQARDSLENLLFSLCRYHELVGAYPERVTVVSFGFKRRRFEELHRRALRLPRATFSFVGIDPPDLPANVPAAERANSYKEFQADPYGCRDPSLRRKRADRNPFRRSISYPDGCPELAPLIEGCPDGGLYDGPLPWSAALTPGDDASMYPGLFSKGVGESSRDV